MNTRTQSGRAAYDAAVFEAIERLGGEQISAVQIRAAAGGSPAQARGAVDRLIESKRVVFEGKTRATRYSLAG